MEYQWSIERNIRQQHGAPFRLKGSRCGKRGQAICRYNNTNTFRFHLWVIQIYTHTHILYTHNYWLNYTFYYFPSTSKSRLDSRWETMVLQLEVKSRAMGLCACMHKHVWVCGWVICRGRGLLFLCRAPCVRLVSTKASSCWMNLRWTQVVHS